MVLLRTSSCYTIHFKSNPPTVMITITHHSCNNPFPFIPQSFTLFGELKGVAYRIALQSSLIDNYVCTFYNTDGCITLLF